MPMPTIYPPTPDEQVGRCLAYLFIGAVGVIVVATPDEEVLQTALGFWSAVVWALFIMTGFPAAIAALMGRYRVEYVLLPLFTAALLVANVYAWYRFGWVTHDIDVVPRLCISTALMFLLAVRARTLHRLIKVLKWTRPLHKQ